MSLTAEQSLGRYRVEAHVGGGGFGDVYRAYDPLLRRKVALKVVHACGAGIDLSSAKLSSCLAEARAASALNYPGIVTIHDLEESGTGPFIVMEWIQGRTLRETLKAPQAITLSEVAEIGSQVAAALARAHEAGIVHRDLKPENIMRRDDGVVKLLDFGLAIEAVVEERPLEVSTFTTPIPDSDDTVTMPMRTRVAGTPGYIAPELFRGEAPSPSSDLFSLGVILYEMLVRRHPFGGTTPRESQDRILFREPLPMSLPTPLPVGWEESVMQLLDRDPTRRPSSATSILHLLGSQRLHILSKSADRSVVNRRVARMVARKPELDRLSRRWDQARQGLGSYVLLEGEPGIGKTTTVERFIADMSVEGQTLLVTGRCSQGFGPGESYVPFLDALSNLLESEQGAVVRSILRGKAPTWYAQLFPPAVGESLPEELRQVLLGANEARMRKELVDALEEVGRVLPVCLVLEDMHWADASTAGLVSYLAGRIQNLPVLVVLTYRPSDLRFENPDLEKILLDLEGRGIAHRLPLGFLAGTDIAEYLALEFPGHRFPERLPDWLHEKSEGNPLLMTDLIRFLMDEGFIANGKGWRFQGTFQNLEGEIPTSGRAMLLRAVGRLSPEHRQLLEVAAVSGDAFDSLILADVTGLDRAVIDRALHDLSSVNALVAPEPEEQYPDESIVAPHRFVHALYQNHLYGELAPNRRVAVHTAVGKAIESHLGTETPKHAARLGSHFERGHLFAKAVDYYLQASHNEASRFAFHEAERFCSRALELVEKLSLQEQQPRRFEVLFERFQMRSAHSHFQEALDDLAAMERAADAAKDTEWKIKALYLQTWPLFYLKREDDLRVMITRLSDLAARTGDGTALQGARIGEANRSLTYDGDLVNVANLAQLIYEDAKRSGNKDFLFEGIVALLSKDSMIGRYCEALAELGMCYNLDHRIGEQLIGLLFNAGLIHGNLGDFTSARIVFEESYRLATLNDEVYWATRLPNSLAWLHYESFDHESSMRINRESLDTIRASGLLEPLANTLINIGLTAIELRNMELAKDSLSETLEVFAHDDWLRWRYRQRLELAWSDYHLRLGDRDTAEEHARACLDLAGRTSRGKHFVLAYAQLALISMRRGRTSEAATHLDSAFAELAKTDSVLAARRLHCIRGDHYRAIGREAEARADYAQALDYLVKLAEKAPSDLRASIQGSELVRSLKAETGLVPG